MQFECYSKILASMGLEPTEINCLHPDTNLYNVLAYQPTGHITYSRDFVRNLDQVGAEERHLAFATLAKEQSADLALVPEYSCPWKVIQEMSINGPFPDLGKLWVFGCESIPFAQLESLKAVFGEAAELLFENVGNQPGKKFVDPVCYLFNAKSTKDNLTRRVVLVQFKTDPMGDQHGQFERDNLQLGKTIYKLTNPSDQSVVMATLLCSDALNCSTKLTPLLRDSLILHLQLNGDPRNSTYTDYRKFLFRPPEHTVNLLCLNWAQNIRETTEAGGTKDWKNIGGSGFYSRSKVPKDSDINSVSDLFTQVAKPRNLLGSCNVVDV